MSDSKHNTPGFTDRLTTALSRYRRFLLWFGLALVIGVIGSVAIFQVLETRHETAAREAELIATDWEAWENTAADDTDRLSALESGIRTRASALLQDHPRSYGSLRTLHILAQLEWALGNHTASRDRALEIPNRFPDSHLVGTALTIAAAAAEESGDLEEAREYLRRIATGEGAPTAEAPRALFNLGRLSEATEAFSEALDYYNQLIDEHPTSNWTNLGRNRIIHLTSQGVAADT